MPVEDLSQLAAHLQGLREIPLPGHVRQMWRLEAQLKRVLLTNVPGRMLKVRCNWAIDLVLVPYYGQPAQDPEEVKHSGARDGTTSAANQDKARRRF